MLNRLIPAIVVAAAPTRRCRIAAIVFASSVLCSVQALAVPILTNGSLTGPITNGGVPSGWTTLAGSPDTMDENNNVGGAFGGFDDCGSPSGGFPPSSLG